MNWQQYHRLSRTGTYSFLAALPLLLLYEVSVLLVGGRVRVGADVWIKQALAWVGAIGWAALGAVVLAIGGVILWRERRQGIELRARYFGWMVAESTIYAVVLAWLVAGTVGAIFAMVPAGPPFDVWTQLALSIGAGLYEELVFRVLLVGGLYAGLRYLMPQGVWAYVVAAVVGALCFSAVHYLGVLGDPFTLPSFTFRFLFGLALNVVFLVRGFGVAAWTHALYDVLLTLGLL